MVARVDCLSNVSFTDHGVSDDAQKLRSLMRTALEGRFKEALEALMYASEDASEDNWDGYGARKVDTRSLKHAQIFLLALPTIISLPEVSVDPDGEIAFTWQRAQRLVFSVSISKDGVLTYAGLFGRNKTHGTEDFVQAIPKTIMDNLERLFSTER